MSRRRLRGGGRGGGSGSGSGGYDDHHNAWSASSASATRLPPMRLAQQGSTSWQAMDDRLVELTAHEMRLVAQIKATQQRMVHMATSAAASAAHHQQQQQLQSVLQEGADSDTDGDPAALQHTLFVPQDVSALASSMGDGTTGTPQVLVGQMGMYPRQPRGTTLGSQLAGTATSSTGAWGSRRRRRKRRAPRPRNKHQSPRSSPQRAAGGGTGRAVSPPPAGYSPQHSLSQGSVFGPTHRLPAGTTMAPSKSAMALPRLSALQQQQTPRELPPPPPPATVDEQPRQVYRPAAWSEPAQAARPTSGGAASARTSRRSSTAMASDEGTPRVAHGLLFRPASASSSRSRPHTATAAASDSLPNTPRQGRRLPPGWWRRRHSAPSTDAASSRPESAGSASTLDPAWSRRRRSAAAAYSMPPVVPLSARLQPALHLQEMAHQGV